MITEWRFRKIQQDQKQVDPTHRAHLNAVDSLVREAVQNSLDATIEGQPTRMFFTLGESKSVDVADYFESLRPHLEATAKDLSIDLPDPTGAIRFLAVEDQNTRGLEGDPAAWKQSNAERSKNHFLRFWRAIGQSGGSTKRRGSRGVGKVVFANASKIRTFFGLTLRNNDISPLLMGEAGLAIHGLIEGGDLYDWYGYFANFRGDGSMAEPISDPTVIDRFSAAFSLNRKAPGLSIVVPHVKSDIKLDGLAKAVIEQFFLSILAGRLEITLREGSRKIDVTRSGIDQAARALKWPPNGYSAIDEMRSLLALARWQTGLQSAEYSQLRTFGSNGESTFPLDSKLSAKLSGDFSEGRRIAVRFNVEVRPKDGAAALEEVRVVLERGDKKLRRSNIPHVRSGINISDLRWDGGPGIRGLVVIGNEFAQGELDKLLQASEGPAHLNWELRGDGYDKAKSMYQNAPEVIKFMRCFVHDLIRDISTKPDEADSRTLSIFFPDVRDASNGNGDPEPPKLRRVVRAGTITGEVVLLASNQRVPVAASTVRLSNAQDVLSTISTAADGTFQFDDLRPDDYVLDADKADVGKARKHVTLGSEHGEFVSIILHRPAVQKAYIIEELPSGFAIQGNPKYVGALRDLQVRIAYAAWGGAKSFAGADFSLDDESLAIAFSGVQESERTELIKGPNMLRFRPVSSDFYVDVQGFDVNRALSVDVRAVGEDASASEGV